MGCSYIVVWLTQAGLGHQENGGVVAGELVLTGCDFWPPALQTQVEELRTELHDVLVEKLNIEKENADLRERQASMQQTMDEKDRDYKVLLNRVATLATQEGQPTSWTQPSPLPATMKPLTVQGLLFAPTGATPSDEGATHRTSPTAVAAPGASHSYRCALWKGNRCRRALVSALPGVRCGRRGRSDHRACHSPQRRCTEVCQTPFPAISISEWK